MTTYIEDGWNDLVVMAGIEAPPRAMEMMREMFFAGAKHLHRTVVEKVTPGEEVHDADIQMMEDIHLELEAFIRAYEQKHRARAKAGGNNGTMQ